MSEKVVREEAAAEKKSSMDTLEFKSRPRIRIEVPSLPYTLLSTSPGLQW
jgi:hypothetical protein